MKDKSLYEKIVVMIMKNICDLRWLYDDYLIKMSKEQAYL